MNNQFKLTVLLILSCSTFIFAQNRTPDYSFKLGNVTYFMLETKGKPKSANDTTFYNLYRFGKTQKIVTEIKSVVNRASRDTLKKANFEVKDNSISFYIFAKKQPVIHRLYTQNTKGLLALKTSIFEDKSAGMGVVEVPPTPKPNAYRPNKAMVEVDVSSEYPGGMNQVRKFIADNLQYPDEAEENEIEGTVRAKFIVEIDGSVSNVQIEKKLGYGCDEEVIRVLKKMHKWKPAELKGKPVRSYIVIPVTFKTQ